MQPTTEGDVLLSIRETVELCLLYLRETVALDLEEPGHLITNVRELSGATLGLWGRERGEGGEEEG